MGLNVLYEDIRRGILFLNVPIIMEFLLIVEPIDWKKMYKYRCLYDDW